MNDLLCRISRLWDEFSGWRIEKGLARMDDTQIARDLARKATMRVSGVFVTDIPPVRRAVTRTGKLILWLPGEVLPRYAKEQRDLNQCDVAVGNVAYYAWYPNSRHCRRSAGRKYLEWWCGPGHEPVILSDLIIREVA